MTCEINCSKFNSRNWFSLWAKNLSSHSDERFKLAQILETRSGQVMFDLRQTTKGKLTTNGFSLILPELLWFKDCIVANDDRIRRLEHNNRIITITKNPNNEILVAVKKSNGSEKILSLADEEKNVLIEVFPEVETLLSKRAAELCLPMHFDERSYYKSSIE